MILSRFLRTTAGAVGVLCALAGCRAPEREIVITPGVSDVVARDVEGCAPLVRVAREDPIAFLRMCRDHYDVSIADYRCVFIKQERIDGVLRAAEEVAVLFRERPFSVDMTWLQNPGRAKRVNYVAGRWREDGSELFHVQPSGVLGLLAPGGVKRDIHGPEAQASSRRSIDEFGFRNTLARFIRAVEQRGGDPVHRFSFVGMRTFDGRACYAIERRPVEAPGDPRGEKSLTILIDRVWLVPICTRSYADVDGKQLLGSYCMEDVEFNVGLTDADFEP